jgi:hypothetical protein
MIGVVQYTISQEEPDTINAICLSTSKVSLRYTVICIGTAKGDTSNGFPGKYEITYWGGD